MKGSSLGQEEMKLLTEGSQTFPYWEDQELEKLSNILLAEDLFTDVFSTDPWFFIMQNTEHHTSSGFMWASLVFLYWWECSFPEFQLIGFFSFTYFSVKALIIVSWLLALGTINYSFPHFHFIFSNNMTGISPLVIISFFFLMEFKRERKTTCCFVFWLRKVFHFSYALISNSWEQCYLWKWAS